MSLRVIPMHPYLCLHIRWAHVCFRLNTHCSKTFPKGSLLKPRKIYFWFQPSDHCQRPNSHKDNLYLENLNQLSFGLMISFIFILYYSYCFDFFLFYSSGLQSFAQWILSTHLILSILWLFPNWNFINVYYFSFHPSAKLFLFHTTS